MNPAFIQNAPQGRHEPGFFFRGWAYPQVFPHPPLAHVRPGGPEAQLWFNRLDAQYPPTDRDRYHRAWASWLSTPAGQPWNGVPHAPNYGPHVAGATTRTLSRQQTIANNAFQAQLADIPPSLRQQAHQFPIMQVEVPRRHFDESTLIRQPYRLY